MPTAKKRETVKELQQLLTTSQVLIFTDYRGMSVAEITNLRRQLREKGVEYHVAKNTLANLAATRANLDTAILGEMLDGPTAIAFVGDDIPGGARALRDFVRTARSTLQIRGGMVGKQLINADQVDDLTRILSREQYIAQMLGSMKAPMSNLVGVLSNTIRGFMNVLNAHIEKLKEGGDTSAEGAAPEGATMEATGEAATDAAPEAGGATEPTMEAASPEAPAEPEAATEATEAAPEPTAEASTIEEAEAATETAS
jgi:large subunit ribosomal protein L10